MDSFKKCTTGCPHFQELAGTFGFMFVTTAMADMDAFKYAATFMVFYHLFRSQFGSRANFNPVLTVADIMSNRSELISGIYDIISQYIGAFLGMILARVLFPVAAVELSADFDFSQVVLTEFIGTGILVWMWLSIHDKDSETKWRDEFIGFAAGLMYFVAGSVVSASMNPAKFECGWSASQVVAGGWGTFIDSAWWGGFISEVNLTHFMAPVCAAFLTSLVYQWHKN